MVWAQFVWFLVSLVVSVALAPKPPKPKPATIDDFDLPTAQLDRPLPVLFGTKRITGANVLWYGDLLATKIKQRSLFSSTTIGFRYHLGIQFGLGYGPVDELSKIEVGDKELWTGSVTSSQTLTISDKSDMFGGDKKEGGMVGKLAVMMGESAQTANTYLDGAIAGPMPAFRSMFGIVWERTGVDPTTGREYGYIGNSPFAKPFAFTAKRILKGWHNDLVWYSAKAAVGNGMNAAHIIYQVLTDPRFGQGTTTAQIDEASFIAAADALHTEGLGLNLLWNQSSRVEDFLQIVVDHIGGVLALDPGNNKYVLKLFRGDYDPGTLDEFGVDQISEAGMESLQTQGWGETVNELQITYTDPDTLKAIPIVVQDLANIRNQGGVVAESIDRSGIADNDMITLVASRELAARSSPLWRARFAINREFWDKTIGDVFKLTWPRPDLQSVVMRVMNTNAGALEDGKIAVEALQDIYSLTGLNYNVAQEAAAQTAALPPVVAADTNPNVLSKALSGPPSGPADGDRYYIPIDPAATGDWASHEGEIAEYDSDSDSYVYFSVPVGVLFYDEESEELFSTDDTGATSAFTGGGVDLFTGVMGNDLEEPLSGLGDGDRYFIPATPTAIGPWAGEEGNIAVYNLASDTWSFIDVPIGLIIYHITDDDYFTSNGAGTVLPAPWIGGLANPVPVLDSINPPFVDLDGPAFDLTLTGSDFNYWSVGLIGGIPRPLQYVDSTELIVSVPASDISVFGTKAIEVANALPGGGLSDEVLLTVGQLIAYSEVAFHSHFDGTDAATTAVDESDQAATMAFIGNAQIDTAQSVFGGASLLLDGSGDYVSVPSHVALNFGDNDFTVEFRMRQTSTGTYNILSGSAGGVQWAIYMGGTTVLKFQHSGSDRVTGGSLTNGVWYHIALTRKGDDFKMYIDGVQIGSTNTSVVTFVQASLEIGRRIGSGAVFPGHIEEVRVVNGTVIYQSNFTPPTEEFWFHRVVLQTDLNGDDADTTLTSQDRYLQSATFAGTAQLDTAEKKFGSSSLLLDGNSDFVDFAHSANMTMDSSGDFTIECFFRLDRLLSATASLLNNGGSSGNSWPNWLIRVTSVERLEYVIGNSAAPGTQVSTGFGATSITIEEWHHAALVWEQSAGKISLYLDGGLESSASGLGNPSKTNTRPIQIGYQDNEIASNHFPGHIDEIRVTKGKAVYTGAFTPPEAPHPLF